MVFSISYTTNSFADGTHTAFSGTHMQEFTLHTLLYAQKKTQLKMTSYCHGPHHA